MSLTSLLAEVLFIGHSLVGPQLPGMVSRAAAAQGVEMRAEAQIINGAPLVWNWNNADKAEGVNGRKALETGRYDHLVLAEAIPLANHIQWSGSGEWARSWADLARASRPGAQVWIYETWHSLDSGTGRPVEHDAMAHLPWRERLDSDWSSWQDIARAAGPDVRVIPAGQAMGRLADEIAKGTIPGLKDIREVFNDDIHPNDRGLYLITMVMHAALTGRDPRGLPPRLVRQWSSRSTVVTEPMARRMQDIAWQVVRERVSAAPPAVVPRRAAATPPPAPTPAPVVLPSDPGGADPLIAALGGVTAPGIGFGLAGVNDWSVQQPFLDVMKTARPWTGHLPGQWGGREHDDLDRGGWLGANGWPRAIPPELTSLSTLVLTDLPANAGGVAGRYILTHSGKGRITLGGRAQNVRAEAGRISFDFSPGEGGVLVSLTALDPADPIRDIRILRADREALANSGAVFNPDWLARIRGARLIRFMDWMATNGSTLARLQDRPQPRDYTWARIGVPVEIMVALANELRADPWLTLPHLSEDPLIRTYAEIVHRDLAPGLTAHVELSNEVWNWGFAQSHWAEAQARARWGGQEWAWVQFYALRASEMSAIWAGIFRDDPSRLVRVLATQTGWIGLEDAILNAPLVVAEGRPAPHTLFDAWAVTGYLSGGVGGTEAEAPLRRWLADSQAAAQAAARARGLTGAALQSEVTERRFDQAIAIAIENVRDGRHTGDTRDTLRTLLDRTLPHHAQIARAHGLRLMMYEGGTHVTGLDGLRDDPEITAFLTRLNYAPQMGAIYRDLIDGWRALSDAPFNAFVDVQAPSRWGSWGALRHLADDSPRWRAIAQKDGR